MTASFPTSVHSFPTLVDGVDDVLASHQNDPNLEIVAIENYLIESATQKTVSGGVLTVDKSHHKVQPQTGTADDIDTITGIPSGAFAILFTEDQGTDTLTYKHNTGNIYCPGAADMSSSFGFVIAYNNGTKILLAGGGGGGGTWGSITGTLSDQTDLNSALDARAFWKTMPGTPTRASNTTFTVTGDYSSVTTYPFGKGMFIKWTESGVVKLAMQSIPQTYSAPNTTFTIIGDTMASIDAGSLKYSMIGAEAFCWKFAKAGSIVATETDAFNCHYAEEPMRVIGADLQVGTAGTTNNTTIDPNKGGTTMFTTKPTLATTVASSPTPFTADSGTSLALGDKVTGDVDAVQTAPAIDLYWTLYVLPTRYLYLT